MVIRNGAKLYDLADIILLRHPFFYALNGQEVIE